MKSKLIVLAFLILSSSSIFSQVNGVGNELSNPEELRTMLDSVFTSEQEPITLRDSFMKKYGVESDQALEQHKIYEANHLVNEEKIKLLLDTEGWPSLESVGEEGIRTICNVLQHSSVDIRIKYLPMMREAVATKDLSSQLLVRAEDRLATDRGELQMYGGQMKYYPETKSFNVWPVFEPQNIDERRKRLGLSPIAAFLQQRFDFEWDLDEQIKRTEKFIADKKSKE
jgi:hypothetical protein